MLDRGLNYLKWLITYFSGHGIKAKLLRSGLGSLLVKVLSILLGFFVTIVLARSLGTKGYGVFAFAIALVSMIAIPAKIGLPQVVLRETAKGYELKNWDFIRGLWRWSNLSALASSAFFVLISSAFVYFQPMYTGEGARMTLFLSLAAIPLIVFSNIRSSSLRGLHKVVESQVPETVVRPAAVLLIIGVWTILFEGTLNRPEEAMIIHLVSAFIAFSLGWIMVIVLAPTQISESSDRKYKVGDWTAAALPMALAGSMTHINQYADILILGVLGSPENVGVYRVVVQIAMLVVIGQQIVNMVIPSYITKFYANGDFENLMSTARGAAKLSFIFALFTTLVVVFGGEWILGSFFGSEFREGYYALVILSIGQTVSAGMGSLGSLLTMTGHERVVAVTVSKIAVANVLLNIVLIPLFGIEGAASATAISLVLWNILIHKRVRVFLGFNVSIFFTQK